MMSSCSRIERGAGHGTFRGAALCVVRNSCKSAGLACAYSASALVSHFSACLVKGVSDARACRFTRHGAWVLSRLACLCPGQAAGHLRELGVVSDLVGRIGVNMPHLLRLIRFVGLIAAHRLCRRSTFCCFCIITGPTLLHFLDDGLTLFRDRFDVSRRCRDCRRPCQVEPRQET